MCTNIRFFCSTALCCRALPIRLDQMLLPCLPFKWQTVAFFFGSRSVFHLCPKQIDILSILMSAPSAKCWRHIQTPSRSCSGWSRNPCAVGRPTGRVVVSVSMFMSRHVSATLPSWLWVVCAANGDPSLPSLHPCLLCLFRFAFHANPCRALATCAPHIFLQLAGLE